MSSSSDWEMPQTVQPKPENYAYNLEGALTSLVVCAPLFPPTRLPPIRSAPSGPETGC